MKIFLIGIIAAFTFLLSTEAQNVIVSASFDSTEIYIGDQIDFTIIVDQPSDIYLTLPAFRDTLIRNIEILDGPLIDTIQLQENRIRITEKYLVTSFDSGLYRVPPVLAELKNEDGVRRFYSDISQLEVIRVNIAPQDTSAKIFDIIKPYSAPLTLGELLPWILISIISFAALWAILNYMKKLRNQKSGTVPVVYIEPAHIIALRELDSLKDEMLPQKGEIKKYYTRLTEILRQYLENRFRIFSLELTTSETLEELIKTGFKKDESYVLLKNVLTDADLVKFAKYKPSQQENDLNLENAYKFVNNTKIEPETDTDTGKTKTEEGII